MSAKSYWVSDTEGDTLLLNGKPIISESGQAKVPGLREKTVDAQFVSSFGDSGEVFDHIPFRSLMSLLWSFPASRGYLLWQCTMLIVRGKTNKINYKGDSVTLKIPLPGVNENERKPFEKILGNSPSFGLIINYPTESSSVPSNALTPERFKCVNRKYVVGEMLKIMRFSAPVEAVGFGDMIRDLKLHKDGAVNDPFWKDITKGKFASYISVTSMIAGAVSTKEIYMEDENDFPGCVFWAGVVAMMTDARNKLIASRQPSDKRARLENSNFYSDFKRKMATRKIDMIQTSTFMDFMNGMAPKMQQFLKSDSNMTAEESTLLDSLINNTIRRAETNLAALKKDDSLLESLSANDPTTYSNLLADQFAKFKVEKEDEYKERMNVASGSR